MSGRWGGFPCGFSPLSARSDYSDVTCEPPAAQQQHGVSASLERSADSDLVQRVERRGVCSVNLGQPEARGDSDEEPQLLYFSVVRQFLENGTISDFRK